MEDTMLDAVYFLLEVDIKSGEMDKFEALVKELLETAQAEPKTLDYDVSLGEDGKTCHFFERYADSEALVAHVSSFGKNFAERFLSLVTPTRLVVYGNASDEAKKALSGFSPVFMSPIGGLSR
jgi:quinol monooxygenase YgiN